MDNLLTIQEMSRLTGLSAHTLRYYEKEGMLEGVVRNEQGYRVYSEADVSWVQFLVVLRELDIPIREMKRYSNLRSQGPSTVHERRLMLEAHQSRVEEQRRKLSGSLEKIARKIEYYKEMEEALVIKRNS
ncbi:MerR family transcriptional regulator [Paenibacillus graminis]|uniref:MerR family transcriptional regulator n=1 Tax=Paenibacillus graminis TaxID=189425 RepID=A0A089M1J3_9BACL|nr:MerR family transcriptional regulator [Paenibacillus graminis]AIQ67042.1 MerR family transcriptional regulator [Paenibacillus graminis]MEC0172717.1 MerR family transcriptional regulator [Paenibacillus graminis]